MNGARRGNRLRMVRCTERGGFWIRGRRGRARIEKGTARERRTELPDSWWQVKLRWKPRAARNQCGRWLLRYRKLALFRQESACSEEFWRWHGPGRTCPALAPQEAKR